MSCHHHIYVLGYIRDWQRTVAFLLELSWDPSVKRLGVSPCQSEYRSIRVEVQPSSMPLAWFVSLDISNFRPLPLEVRQQSTISYWPDLMIIYLYLYSFTPNLIVQKSMGLATRLAQFSNIDLYWLRGPMKSPQNGWFCPAHAFVYWSIFDRYYSSKTKSGEGVM